MAALPPVPPSFGSSGSSPPSGPDDRELQAVVGGTTSRDIERDYGVRDTQRRWQEASYAIICEIASQQKPSPWKELFENLAERRHALAEELGQGVNGPCFDREGNDFGILRTQGDINATHKEDVAPRGTWAESYPMCRVLLLDWMKREFGDQQPADQVIRIRSPLLDLLIDAIGDKGRLSDAEKQAMFAVSSPEQMEDILGKLNSIFDDCHRGNLAAICVKWVALLDSFKAMENFQPTARIVYPTGYFVQAVMERSNVPTLHPYYTEQEIDPIAYRDAIDQAYAALLQPEANVQEFRYKAAKFYYLMLRLLPCHRGTASIIDWMMRGIALQKGYKLGPYNHEELGWDMKALLTPSEQLEKYCEWFRDRAWVQ